MKTYIAICLKTEHIYVMPRIILVCNFADSLACIFWKYEKKKILPRIE